MRKTFVAAVTVALLALLVSPATGAPGGNGNGNGGGNGKGGGNQVVVASSIVLDGYSDLRLGGYVGFSTVASGLKGNEWPMVEVRCLQAGEVVWARVASPETEFKLGGDSSPWLEVGGEADCTAYLLAYPAIAQLASTEFQAAG